MRIASLLPSATEIAHALGLGDSLVGISHECDYPPRLAARELPVLTASILDAGLDPRAIDAAVHAAVLESRPIYSVDGPRMLALEPGLILTQGVCSVCAVTPETIDTALKLTPMDALVRGAEGAGTGTGTQLLSLGATTFEGMLDDVQAVAEAAGVGERGRALVASLRAEWAGIEAGGELPSPGGEGPLRVFFLEWPDPPWLAGHWVPEQIQAAGGRDVFGRAGAPSRPLPWSEIAAADPDWILAGACGYDLATNLEHARALLEHPEHGPEVRALRAVREGRFWALDANGHFSRPAPRLVRGAALLRKIFETTGGSGAKNEGVFARVGLRCEEAAPVRPSPR